jgi:hypothetical protein
MPVIPPATAQVNMTMAFSRQMVFLLKGERGRALRSLYVLNPLSFWLREPKQLGNRGCQRDIGTRIANVYDKTHGLRNGVDFALL